MEGERFDHLVMLKRGYPEAMKAKIPAAILGYTCVGETVVTSPNRFYEVLIHRVNRSPHPSAPYSACRSPGGT